MVDVLDPRIRLRNSIQFIREDISMEDWSRQVSAMQRASDNPGHPIKPWTQFGSEYWAWRENGYSHVESLNKARDYYRKYIRREILNSDEMSIDHTVESDDPSVDEQADVQILFDRVMDNLENEKDIKLFIGIISMENLDVHLSPDQKAVVDSVINDNQITCLGDLAEFIGYKLGKNGSCQSMLLRRYDLRDLVSSLGFGRQEAVS